MPVYYDIKATTASYIQTWPAYLRATVEMCRTNLMICLMAMGGKEMSASHCHAPYVKPATVTAHVHVSTATVSTYQLQYDKQPMIV